MPEHPLRLTHVALFSRTHHFRFFYLEKTQGQQRFIAAGLVFIQPLKADG
jgi:hypothetical protein